MRILGFDVASKTTGYATISGKRLLKRGYGTIVTSPKNSIAERLVVFRDSAEKVILRMKPDMIVIEDVYIRHLSSAIILARFSGVILELCSRLGYVPTLLATTTVRKLLKVPNKKDKVFEFVKGKFKLDSFKFSTHNDITDAIALCLALQES